MTPVFRRSATLELRIFKKQGTTLLLVSHSAGDIVKHCDRAIFLKNGDICMDSTARDVTNRYLDELFGKTDKNSTPKSETATLSASGESQMSLDEIEDVYHTRPGYRPERISLGGREGRKSLIITSKAPV